MDRITHIRIKNVRAIEDLDLELSPTVTVLIGENGSGKSTIIECLELLRRAAEPSFMEQFYAIHRGMPGLLRNGARGLQLTVIIEDDHGQRQPLGYTFGLARRGSGAVVQGELLIEHDITRRKSSRALVRSAGQHQMRSSESGELGAVPNGMVTPEQLTIGALAAQPPGSPFHRLLNALRGIEVHLGLDTLAEWAGQAIRRSSPMRGSTLLRPARRLDLLGHNLASAWHELKNRGSDHWNETLGLVRLGLGQHIDTVIVAVDAGGGQGALSLKQVDSDETIPAANLSDGQLTWLAFVALARLSGGRSLLAIDEPERHLHPALLGRVMALLTELEGGPQVVLGTHSDRVLELLDDPASAIRVCSLEGGRAVVSRLDPNELPRWLEQFGDMGQLRASGYLPRVLVPTAPAPSEALEDGQ